MSPKWQELYPFASHYLEVPVSEASTQRVRMHYIDEGPRPMAAEAESASEAATGAKATILCVHGNPTWSFTFREIARRLSGSTRVIAVDHIGCGLSDKPQDYDYSLQQHVGNLARLIEQLDLHNITLVVHDWGGAIGLGAGLKHQSRIQRLVILNTAAFPPPYVPWRIAACRLPRLGEWGIRGLNLFARAALTMAINRLDRLPPPVAAGLLAPYHDWDSRIAIARFVQDIPRRKGHPTWQALSRIEQGLPMFADRPARIIWGMKDWCFRPECLERFQKLLPQAQVRQLEDVGHYVMEEAAEEVISELNDLHREHGG